MNPPQIEDFDLLPTTRERDEERERATLELGHAVLRHRKAWQAMIDRKATLRKAFILQGKSLVDLDISCEEDHIYKRAVGDLKFWREEIQTAAALVTALDHVAVRQAIPRPRGSSPRSAVIYQTR